MILFLLLILFFLKPRFFSQLFQTIIGRTFLVILILFITYCNPIWGLVFVLFLMIMYANYSVQLEGLELPTKAEQLKETEGLTLEMSKTKEAFAKEAFAKVETVKEVAKEASAKAIEAKKVVEKIKEKLAELQGEKKSEQTTEGFDLLGLEDKIKRGNFFQASNKNSDNVIPYEKSLFTPFHF